MQEHNLQMKRVNRKKKVEKNEKEGQRKRKCEGGQIEKDDPGRVESDASEEIEIIMNNMVKNSREEKWESRADGGQRGGGGRRLGFGQPPVTN